MEMSISSSRNVFTISLLFFLSLKLSSVAAFDYSDPTGNITIRWDVMTWTPDGYVAVVNITNNQLYRTVQKPGWQLGWNWTGREVIWTAIGAQAIDQGNCSRFKGNIPHSCERRPTMKDLNPGVPYNQQVYGCCKGGILQTKYQDLDKSTAGFQITVGNAGTTNKTVKMPRNITFVAGRGGYTCGPAKIVVPTRFTTSDGRRVTRAFMTWKVVCTYSSFLASKYPTCCVSMSSFNRRKKANCPNCSCGCRNETCNTRSKGNPGFVPPLMKCSDHMCPVRINWEMLMPKRKGADWTVKVSITNYNYRVNYSDWNLVVDHPAINKLTKVLHANHRRLSPKTMEMMWGIRRDNEVITTSGSKGSTVSWIMQMFKDIGGGKHNKSISNKNYVGVCKRDWCAPKQILFNGDQCVIPPLLPLQAIPSLE